MSFLKNLFSHRRLRGQTVYNHLGQEVGHISTIRTDGTSLIYEIQSCDTQTTFSFPQDQFYQEGNRYFLLPQWLSTVQAAFTQITQVKHQFAELCAFKEAFPVKTYLTQLTELANRGITRIEEIMTHFTQFEEYLITLNHVKETLLSETSQLMSLRLLTAGKKREDKPILSRKTYSLKIIALKQRFQNVAQLIHFVAELHEQSNTCSNFIDELLQELQHVRAQYLIEAPQIQQLQARATNVSLENHELITLLDGIMSGSIQD